MYEVGRTHSQSATTQPGGLSDLKRSKWQAVPPGPGGVVVAAQHDDRLLATGEVPEARQRQLVALHQRDHVQQQPLLFVGLRDRDLVVSIQSGWTSPARAP